MYSELQEFNIFFALPDTQRLRIRVRVDWIRIRILNKKPGPAKKTRTGNVAIVHFGIGLMEYL